jgi:hypothetical protein
MLIKDRFLADGGFIERRGITAFNLYRAPTLRHGDGFYQWKMLKIATILPKSAPILLKIVTILLKACDRNAGASPFSKSA